MEDVAYIIVPGYNNSEPEHWQSHWEKNLSGAVRVNQRDWLNPVCAEWVAVLDETIQQAKGKIIIIAHSLGCSAVVQWAKDHSADVIGALLVSPPDLELLTDPALIALAKTFIPINTRQLPFKNIVIASDNDPYAKLDRIKYLAKCWGGKFVNIGAAGHINVESGHHKWLEGLKYLKELES